MNHNLLLKQNKRKETAAKIVSHVILFPIYSLLFSNRCSKSFFSMYRRIVHQSFSNYILNQNNIQEIDIKLSL